MNKRSKVKSKRKRSLRGGSRSQRSQRSRYNYRSTWSRQSARLTNLATKRRINRSTSAFITINSNYKFKLFKREVKEFQEKLDKIQKINYEELRINKKNLLDAWNIGIKAWPKNKFKAINYFILAGLVSTILLNRHGSIKTALGVSTSLPNDKAHLLLRGIADLSPRDTTLTHKSQIKDIIDKCGGIYKFIEYVQVVITDPKNALIEGYDEIKHLDNPDTIEKLYDLIYTCQNPYLNSLIQQFLELSTK